MVLRGAHSGWCGVSSLRTEPWGGQGQLREPQGGVPGRKKGALGRLGLVAVLQPAMTEVNHTALGEAAFVHQCGHGPKVGLLSNNPD